MDGLTVVNGPERLIAARGQARRASFERSTPETLSTIVWS
jgi:hypothetical protein